MAGWRGASLPSMASRCCSNASAGCIAASLWNARPSDCKQNTQSVNVPLEAGIDLEMCTQARGSIPSCHAGIGKAPITIPSNVCRRKLPCVVRCFYETQWISHTF